MPTTINGAGRALWFTWVPAPPGLGESNAGLNLGGKPPCWHCRSFEGLEVASGTAWCHGPHGTKVHVPALHGCSSWQREVGADDEPGPPAMAMLIDWPAP